jgi:hypothetical protein
MRFSRFARYSPLYCNISARVISMPSYVIHALVQKRAELSGDFENTHTVM